MILWKSLERLETILKDWWEHIVSILPRKRISNILRQSQIFRDIFEGFKTVLKIKKVHMSFNISVFQNIYYSFQWDTNF